MDTKRDDRIPQCGILPKIDKNQVVVGAKQLRKALNKGNVKYVCLAKNADPSITEALAQQCEEKNIPCIWVSGMRELGQACGIDVGTAAAAVVN